MLFPTTFISVSEKIGMGLKKQADDVWKNMAGSSRKDFECITSSYPLLDYQVCSSHY